MPASIQIIHDYAFQGCSLLNSFVIPPGSTSLGISAFNGCSQLISVEIPASVTFIGDTCFGNCVALAFVLFVDPSSVTSVGSQVFENNGPLTVTMYNTESFDDLTPAMQQLVSELPLGSVVIYESAPICFGKGTLLLSKGNQYIPVSELKVGMELRTWQHGLRKIVKIKRGRFQNDPHNPVCCFYKPKVPFRNELSSTLRLTGRHGLLVNRPGKDTLADKVEGQYVLMAYQSPWMEPETHRQWEEYWHFALDSTGLDSFTTNNPFGFGVCANGVWVETPHVSQLYSPMEKQWTQWAQRQREQREKRQQTKPKKIEMKPVWQTRPQTNKPTNQHDHRLQLRRRRTDALVCGTRDSL